VLDVLYEHEAKLTSASGDLSWINSGRYRLVDADVPKDVMISNCSDAFIYGEASYLEFSALDRGFSTEYHPTIDIGCWIVDAQEERDTLVTVKETLVEVNSNDDYNEDAPVVPSDGTVLERLGDEAMVCVTEETTEGAPLFDDPTSIEAREVMAQCVREVRPSVERGRVANDAMEYSDSERSAGSATKAATVPAPTRHRKIGYLMLGCNGDYGECASECRASLTRRKATASVPAEPVRTVMRAESLRWSKYLKRIPDEYSGDGGECAVKEAVAPRGAWKICVLGTAPSVPPGMSDVKRIWCRSIVTAQRTDDSVWGCN
jgi:hypothetical protein